jgi:WASH complex subunit strumpellin
VCKLCRSTGFSVNATKKPANYPEEFFRRYPIPRSFVQMVLGRLRTDDIYNLIAEYPNPEHRSTALATQASMLYVMLYFAPEMLQNDQVRRRRVCVYVCVRRRERERSCMVCL